MVRIHAAPFRVRNYGSIICTDDAGSMFICKEENHRRSGLCQDFLIRQMAWRKVRCINCFFAVPNASTKIK
ncbi:hypothetical protein D3Z62_21390 [Lachnospiraceae bacterium]|nr:hypothetical protein [Lachnospiraceae bacterium]